jgi:glyoxylase-like metal-dependent hydrolase (beta-lactamase superfamily II)
MGLATELDVLDPRLFLWHAFDSASRTELFSTAIETDAGKFIVDPIPLAPHVMPDWKNVAGIVVTNANHHRSSDEFARRFNVPIFARANSFAEGRPKHFHDLDRNPNVDDAFRSIAIEGAAPGEIVLCANRSLIVGDALINFGPHGFTFLPPKYCTNFRRMRQSLRQLLELDFERILFAHGMPITTRAHERLVQLLEQ